MSGGKALSSFREGLASSICFMPFLRRHSGSRSFLTVTRLTRVGGRSTRLLMKRSVELMAPSLGEAKGIADSLAVVSHVEECNDACNQ